MKELKGVMSINGKPSPDELKSWAAPEIKVEEIDVVLEYLHTKECLNKKGENLAKQFWEKFIKEDKDK